MSDKKTLFKRLVEFVPSIFGPKYPVASIKTDKNLVVLCTNTGGGYVPHMVLLSHQISLEMVEELEKKLAAGGTYHAEIYALPCKSDDSVLISQRDWNLK